MSIYDENSKKKRKHKNSCIYYNKNTQRCSNPKCSKSICTTASNCSCYKRKEIAYQTSSYDDSYLPKPYQASTHETSNLYIGVSKNIGTSMHIGYMKSNEPRRHKKRCIFFDKTRNYCRWYLQKCIGSAICEEYEENNIIN